MSVVKRREGMTVKLRKVSRLNMTVDGHDAWAAHLTITADDGRALRITIVTANIGRGVSTAEARANMRRVLNRFRWFGGRWWSSNVFVCFQEIDEADRPDELALLRSLLPTGCQLIGAGQACVIVVPPGFEIDDERVRVTSAGLAGLSPHRVAVFGVTTHKRKRISFRVADGHWPRSIPALMGRWRDCDASWRQLYSSWVADSIPTFGARDRNEVDARPLHVTETRLTPARLIDEITVV